MNFDIHFFLIFKKKIGKIKLIFNIFKKIITKKLFKKQSWFFIQTIHETMLHFLQNNKHKIYK